MAGRDASSRRQKIGTLVGEKELWNAFDANVLAWQPVNGLGDEILRDLLEIRQLTAPAVARFAALLAGLTAIWCAETACRAMRDGMSDDAS